LVCTKLISDGRIWQLLPNSKDCRDISPLGNHLFYLNVVICTDKHNSQTEYYRIKGLQMYGCKYRPRHRAMWNFCLIQNPYRVDSRIISMNRSLIWSPMHVHAAKNLLKKVG